MSKKSRQNLYRFQAHAVLDALGRCPGGMPDREHFDAQLPKLPCPICLEWKTFDELDEDHAPQRAQQSNLGSAHVVVMTCKGCNGGAGRTYENSASREDALLLSVPQPFCAIHSRQALTPSGLVVSRDLEARGLADLKSAFLVGMATLGYRWAAAPRLAQLRAVIRGSLSPLRAESDFEFVCAHVDGLNPFSVVEVTSPVTCVLVMGAHAGVVMPAAASPRHVSGRVQQRLGGGRFRISASVSARPWPPSFTHSRSIEQVWDAHHLFHYDRCTVHDHAGFGAERHVLAAALGLSPKA
jgi:hypothetical protein